MRTRLHKDPRPGQCEAQVSDHNSRWPAFYQCSSKPKVERDGHHYCNRHDPEVVAAKEAARNAKWEADSKARSAKWEREAKARDTLAAVEAALGPDFTIDQLKRNLPFTNGAKVEP